MLRTIATLQPLLDPQERLDRLIASTFRRFGPRIVDLSYANPCDGPSDEVLSILARATAESNGRSLQYTPIAGRTAARRAVAAQLTRRFEIPFDFRDIVLTAGAMPALNIASRALFGPGDEVIVLTPAWQDYPLYLRNLNITVRLVPLRQDKHLDLDAIRGAIGPATRGVLFSQPCCPTGVVYSREEIDALAVVLIEAEVRFGTTLHIVSDEVHRDVVWSGRACHSPLQSYARSISIYSFGKAFAIQGQRIGYLAMSPLLPDLGNARITIERCARMMGFGHPASTMQRAAIDLLDCRPTVTTLALSQETVRRALTAYGYELCAGDASFYVYVRSPIADDFQFAELLASHGVLVVPSTLFHDPGYIRLSLTAKPEAIVAALPVFATALAEARGGAQCLSRC
jgi:aspartate aminotransferase